MPELVPQSRWIAISDDAAIGKGEIVKIIKKKTRKA